MRVLFFILFIATNVCSLEWDEIELDQPYKLIADIQIPDLLINNETHFLFQNKISLGWVKVDLYKGTILDCSFQEHESDIEIFQDLDFKHIGIRISKNCQFEIFIELIDIYSTSVFEKVADETL